MKKITRAVVVSFDLRPPDKALLLVGEKDKTGTKMNVINQFTGEEAIELMAKLIGGKEDEKSS